MYFGAKIQIYFLVRDHDKAMKAKTNYVGM